MDPHLIVRCVAGAVAGALLVKLLKDEYDHWDGDDDDDDDDGGIPVLAWLRHQVG